MKIRNNLEKFIAASCCVDSLREALYYAKEGNSPRTLALVRLALANALRNKKRFL